MKLKKNWTGGSRLQRLLGSANATFIPFSFNRYIHPVTETNSKILNRMVKMNPIGKAVIGDGFLLPHKDIYFVLFPLLSSIFT